MSNNFRAAQIIRLSVAPATPHVQGALKSAIVAQFQHELDEAKSSLKLVEQYQEMYKAEAAETQGHFKRTAEVRERDCMLRARTLRTRIERLEGQVRQAKRQK